MGCKNCGGATSGPSKPKGDERGFIVEFPNGTVRRFDSIEAADSAVYAYGAKILNDPGMTPLPKEKKETEVVKEPKKNGKKEPEVQVEEEVTTPAADAPVDNNNDEGADRDGEV